MQEQISSKQSNAKPQIIDPAVATYLTMDDISWKFDQLLRSQAKTSDTQSKILDDISKKIDRLLDAQLKTINIQLKTQELIKSTLDEGGRLVQSGTVTPTEYVIINTIADPGHPIRSYTVINEGPNDIYVGYNITNTGYPIPLEAVLADDSLFLTITPNNRIKESFTTKVINNVYILANTGNSSYKARLVW